MIKTNLNITQNITKQYFSRSDLFEALQAESPEAGDSQLRYLLDELIKNNEIVRVGRNKYSKAGVNKTNYENQYSETAEAVISFMEKSYPLLTYCFWELNWLNEFVNHLLAKNIIFLEVEKPACEFVYNDLQEFLDRKILLKPTDKELMYYADYDTVVIIPIITEAPIGLQKKCNVTLEKIIVDLFANKLIAVSRGDYENAIQSMFDKYIIDEKKLFRYARRRGKGEEIQCFLEKISR